MKNTNRVLSEVLTNSKNHSLHAPIPHCASNPATLIQALKEEPWTGIWELISRAVTQERLQNVPPLPPQASALSHIPISSVLSQPQRIPLPILHHRLWMHQCSMQDSGISSLLPEKIQDLEAGEVSDSGAWTITAPQQVWEIRTKESTNRLLCLVPISKLLFNLNIDLFSNPKTKHSKAKSRS